MTFSPETHCHDCGSEARRADREPGIYCRRCGEKNGYVHAYVLELDRDRAVALVGEAVVARLEQDARRL